MRVTCDSTAGIIVDVQERLLPVMDNADDTLERVVTLIKGLGVLEVPMLLTEQYPKGLGPTVEPVFTAFTAFTAFTSARVGAPPEAIVKSAFSCCDDDGFSARLAELNRKTVLIAGIEAHVCVLQTTIDLLERGFVPFVVTDAISSRSPRDRDIALRRLEMEGARLTTVESVLFELTRVSGTPRFKEISRLIK